jgi:hypothetical protein
MQVVRHSAANDAAGAMGTSATMSEAEHAHAAVREAPKINRCRCHTAESHRADIQRSNGED